MQIGNINLSSPTILAPLAGITNLPFRLIIKKLGCGLVCSEMISSNGLVYKSLKTQMLLNSTEKESPISFQIFGSDPELMAKAAEIIEELGADIVDINFGCSVRKILKSGAGAALMKTPDLAEKILMSVRKAINVPLTIKIRTGWDTSGKDALTILKIAEECGVDAITMHPRTAKQGFTGTADWSQIAALKKTAKIPVIGNGDITKPEDALEMISQTSCDGVMVGREAMINPWILAQIDSLIKKKEKPVPDINMHFDLMSDYVKESVIYLGEKKACFILRSRLSWLTKGFYQCSQFRESIKKISSEKETLLLINDYKEILMSRPIQNQTNF